MTSMIGEAGAGAWHNRLPPDLRRAAPEIYRSLQSAVSRSAREWINVQFQGDRNSQQLVDLWSQATEVDFKLGQARSDAELTTILATDDSLDIILRRLLRVCVKDS